MNHSATGLFLCLKMKNIFQSTDFILIFNLFLFFCPFSGLQGLDSIPECIRTKAGELPQEVTDRQMLQKL